MDMSEIVIALSVGITIGWLVVLVGAWIVVAWRMWR